MLKCISVRVCIFLMENTMDGLVFISHSSKDKPVADAICHYLEAKGLRCWIAPRDIKSTDWVGSIMDGLHRSEVFVVIVSQNSLASPQVLNEINEAVNCCNYILPFKLDSEELSDRFRYYLGPCHWLDAISPPLESRIDELSYRILHLSEEDAIYMNSGRYELTERMSYPRPGFIGREAEIEEISATLKDERIVFLQGMGGMGKSEIAKGYAAAHKNEYDKVIFASYNGSLMDLVCSDALPIKNLHRAEKEGNESFFRRKLDVFQALANEKTLLIIDNFDTDEDDQLEELLSMPCRFIFTTRNDHGDYPAIDVGPITDITVLRKIFSAAAGIKISPKDQPVVDEILSLVNGHTITVELVARQMAASFKTPAEMLKILKNAGMNTLKTSVRREGSKDKRNAFDYIRELFSVSGLDQEQQHFLSIMSLLPPSGIRVPMIGEILDMEDYDIVNDMVSSNWLIRSDYYTLQMHPVIADVIRQELKPDIINCKDYVLGLGEKARRFWGMDAEERDILYTLVVRLLQYFPRPDSCGDTETAKELFPAYGQFANAGWICGDFERSQKVSREYYDCAISLFGPGSLQAGLGATYCAAAYYNAGDWAAAGPWYEESFKHQLIGAGLLDEGGDISSVLYSEPDRAKLDKLPANVLEQLYAICTRIARNHVILGNYDKAQKAFDLAEVYADARLPMGNYSYERNHPGWYAGIFLEKTRMYLAQERWEDAYNESNKTLALMEDDLEYEEANMAFPMIYMIKACSHLGRFEEADRWLEQGREIVGRLIGENSRSAFHMRDAEAEKLLLSGRKAEGISVLTTLVLDMEKHLGVNSPETAEMRSKLEALQQG